MGGTAAMDYISQGIATAFQLLARGDAETWSAVITTLRVSSLSILISLLLGIPAGFLLGSISFPGKNSIRTLVDTLLALPTVVVGLLVYSLISRRGPLGEFGLLFTLEGIVIGQVVLGLPIVVALTASAIESLEIQLRQTLLTLGTTKKQLVLSTLWEARYAVTVAAITAYSRIISEVGVSMMLGGNIKWHTRSITTAMALETGKGEFAMGIALGMVLLFIVLLVNLFLAEFKRRSAA